MKTKHTPGEWVVRPDQETNEHGVSVFIIDQSEDAPHEYGSDAQQCHLAEVYDNEPNARLIAAAPELLEALEKLTSDKMVEALGIGFAAIISKNRKSQYTDHSFEEKALIIEKAISAIKKAKGE